MPSKIHRELLLKLVTLVIGLAVAFAMTYVFTDQPGVTKVILSLVTGCVGLLYVEFTRISLKLDEQDKRFVELTRVLSDKSYVEARRASLLRSPCRELKDMANVSEAWVSLLWSVAKSYQATNFIPNGKIYDSGYAKCALSVQSVKREVDGIPVSKVFIVKDDTEHKEMALTMKKQQDLGFDVRVLRYEKIESSRQLSFDVLESVDFGIFDDEVVLVWKLNPTTRAPTSGRILTGEENVSPYRTYFKQLVKESEPFKS